MRIGLFDSGVGGLNVLKEFIKKYPNNTYYYYGDTKNVPYGDKDKETLLKLSTNIIRFFEQKQVDLIVIACGTISASCYNELKKITNIKIIDIITPVISYLTSLKEKNISVFATKRTIESHIFKNNLKEKEVLEVATLEFVPMIESFKIDTNIIKNYVNLIKNTEVLVLGFTHYPLLETEIKKYLTKDILIINMGVVLVSSTELKNNSLPSVNLYFTKIDDSLKKNIDLILTCDYKLELA